MKHPHAELMAEYAKDALSTDKPWELWQFQDGTFEWADLWNHPQWNSHCSYRRKPKQSDAKKYGVAVGDVWKVCQYNRLYTVARVLYQGIDKPKKVHLVWGDTMTNSIIACESELKELVLRRGEVNKL